MNTPPIQSTLPQPSLFQRFTLRLVDGKFVRVPKADLPSVEPQVDPTAASNQTELRYLFRVVNGHFVTTRPDLIGPVADPDLPFPEPLGPDPTFDLPA